MRSKVRPVSDTIRRGGVQSVEVGSALLRALADADRAQTLSALARSAGMSTAKAHRYLVSYIASGLVVQSQANGTYDLGPLAVRVGLAALQRFEVVRVAGERLAELRDAVDATTLMAVWTDDGPTVARIELSRHPVTLAVRVGTAFPLASSATGHVFATFAPELKVARPLDGPDASDPKELSAIRTRVRRDHVASVDQTFLVGVQALSVPLFHADGTLAAALTVIGAPGHFTIAIDGKVAQTMRNFVQEITRT